MKKQTLKKKRNELETQNGVKEIKETPKKENKEKIERNRKNANLLHGQENCWGLSVFLVRQRQLGKIY